MIHKFLYRALRQAEINEKYQLIPKVFSDFFADPVFGIDTVFPMYFWSETNAVRQHQWNQNGLPTRGISTTPYYSRALFYAQHNKVIAKIDTSKFEGLGIKTYDVNQILYRTSDIAVPEDNEIILVYEKDGNFPLEIITEIIIF